MPEPISQSTGLERKVNLYQKQYPDGGALDIMYLIFHLGALGYNGLKQYFKDKTKK